ncbi:MAG: diguanylate cyclase [Eubacteriales bacterium]|nr:diguanylate cyclase [Eubacteriales bacterium]
MNNQFKKLNISFAVALLIMTFLSSYYLRYINNYTIQEASKHAIELSRTIEASINKEALKNLHADESDLSKAEYIALKDSLMTVVKINQDLKFAYLYTLVDDEIKFMVDSEPSDSPDYSPPGQIYTEASPHHFKPFESGEIVLTEPFDDRWGRWVSILVPVLDNDVGVATVVFGIDYPENIWQKHVNSHLAFAAIIVGCLFVILGILYILSLKNNRIRESERSKRVILSNLPGMTYKCNVDRDWTMQFVSEGCLELTGYPAESLMNNKEISFNALISKKYQDYLWDKWQDVISKRTKLKEEYELITRDGSIKWVFEQGQPIFDEKGAVVALEGLIIDITDRKRKEEEITYLNDYDFLTGLFNRRYLDKIKNEIENEKNIPITIIVGDINGLKLINDAFGHEKGDTLIVQTAKLLKECCGDNRFLFRTGGDEFTMVLPNTDEKTAGLIMDQIKSAIDNFNRKTKNEAYYLHLSLGYSTKKYDFESLDHTLKIAEDHMYKRKLLEHKSSHSSIVSSIKATIYERSQETEAHAQRMTFFARRMGERLKFSNTEMDNMELFSALHDLGKIGIDGSILNKPDKLDEQEWIEMKKHPEIGYRIAMASPELVSIAEFILTHHERWDGTGYPQGLKETEIPLHARILAVVDAYDAMTVDRIYRKALTKAEAINELIINKGTQFDPHLVDLFIGTLEENEADYNPSFLIRY